MVAEKIEEKGKLPEDTCAGKSTQELGGVETTDTNLEVVLRQFERERIKDSQIIATACHPEGDICTVRVIQVEPYNCLSAVDSEW